MTIYAISLKLTQALPANQSALSVPEADWRNELSLSLQATLEEGMISQGRRATGLVDAFLRQTNVYADTSTTASPDFEDRFNPQSGHYTEVVGHSQTATHSLSLQAVAPGPWSDLQMGLDEWQDLLVRSANSFYNDIEFEFSVSPALKDVLVACELARTEKLARQFTIVPKTPEPGPLKDYTSALPQLPKKAGELLIMGATTFRLPLYDADPSPFLSGHTEFTGMPMHMLRSHFEGRFLKLNSARLEPHMPAFPNHMGPTLATTAKRILDAVQSYVGHPGLSDFVAHSVRQTTSGITEQVQLLSEMIAQTKFAPYMTSQDILRDLSTRPDDQALGQSVSHCCKQAYHAMQDGGFGDALGSLLRAQQLCHPTRLTDIVEEVLREAPSVQMTGLKRD